MQLEPLIHERHFCRRPSCKNNEMLLQQSENWFLCPICKDVQPIDSDKPLFWITCPDCQYPKLINESENKARNIIFTCHRCSLSFRKA